MRSGPTAPLPWPRLGVLAVLAMAAAFLVVASLVGSSSLLNLVLPSRDTAAAGAFQQDFPDVALPDGDGHDGQYFYVIARQPWDPAEAAAHLDRPRYREQRILYPALARALYPLGNGDGLVWAMVAVGILAVGGGVLATSVVSLTLGGRDWHGLLFAALPGTYWALRLSTSEVLALALTMTAVALSLRRRAGWAVVVGVLAVLAKEPLLLVLLGVAVWRRDRAGLALAAVPAAVAGAWFVLLHLVVDDRGTGIIEFTFPGMGYVDAYRLGWSQGVGADAAFLLGVTLVIAVFGLIHHGLRGPLGWPIALHLALFSVMIANVVGLMANATRATAPLLLLGLLALLVRRPGSRTAELQRYRVGPDLLRRARSPADGTGTPDPAPT